MDDVRENPGALAAHYVLVTCRVPALDLNLDYTYAENAGHFPETVVLAAMRCYRRSVACRQKKMSEPNFAPTKINSLVATSSPSSLLQMSARTYLIFSWIKIWKKQNNVQRQ